MGDDEEWHRFSGPSGDAVARADGGEGTASAAASRPAEPTVLVEWECCELIRLTSFAILDEQFRPGDGVVVVGCDQSDPNLLAKTTGSVGELSPGHVGVVHRGEYDPAGATGPVHQVAQGTDPSALTEAVEAAFREVADLVEGRIHLFVDDIGAVAGGDAETVYDQMYELAMGVGTEPGLALFALDRRSLDDGLLERLPHLFDVRVTLRNCCGEPEASWTALTCASDGWQSLHELTFGEPAFA